MKRVLAILLAALMLVPVLSGCSIFVDTETKGAYINVYLGDELRVWDPALALTDASAVQYLSLVYEGLMKYDNKGKVEKAMCSEYEYDEETNSIVFEIRETAWSDGRRVSADDFIYSWKRILDPDFTSPAKPLLYMIKNARKVVNGDLSIDDLGVASIDTYTLQVELEEGMNYEKFIENLASISLAPIREDYASVYSDWYWTSTNIITNGPFNVKTMVRGKTGEGGKLVIERNRYYDRPNYDLVSDEVAKDTYVTPYRLEIYFGLSEADRDAAFGYKAKDGTVSLPSGSGELKVAADQLHFIAPVAKDSQYADKADALSMLSTASLMINTRNPLFAKAEVRRALSAAIDREALASLYVGAKAATGLVPEGVLYNGTGSSFREKAGNILSTSADIAAAKDLLKSAGVNSGSFTLTYRETGKNAAIAEAVKSAWEELGFRVTLRGVNADEYRYLYNAAIEGDQYVAEDETTEDVISTEEEETTAATEKVIEKIFDNGEEPKEVYNYDVILTDYQSLTAKPFAALAPFALGFSGIAMNSKYGDYEQRPGMTGYSDSAYDALIEKAFSESGNDEEASNTLIEAEKKLLEDMPIIPLFFRANAAVSSSALSGTGETTAYGTYVFTKVSQSSFEDYTTVDESLLPVTEEE